MRAGISRSISCVLYSVRLLGSTLLAEAKRPNGHDGLSGRRFEAETNLGLHLRLLANLGVRDEGVPFVGVRREFTRCDLLQTLNDGGLSAPVRPDNECQGLVELNRGQSSSLRVVPCRHRPAGQTLEKSANLYGRGGQPLHAPVAGQRPAAMICFAADGATTVPDRCPRGLPLATCDAGSVILGVVK
eukprot:scaffold276_cov548-Prasinococcus_capsulatus_cf.AAC.3